MSFVLSPAGQITSVPVPVSQGGSGASTLTNNSVLLGGGTNAIQALTSGPAATILTSAGPGVTPTWSVAGGGQAFIAFGTTGGF